MWNKRVVERFTKTYDNNRHCDTVTQWHTVETPKSERANFNFNYYVKAKSEQNAAQKFYLLFTFSKWTPFLINEFEFGSQFASDATWNGIFRWSQHGMFNWIVIYIHSTTPVLWVLDGEDGDCVEASVTIDCRMNEEWRTKSRAERRTRLWHVALIC